VAAGPPERGSCRRVSSEERRPQALWWVAGIASVATFIADLVVERGTNGPLRIAGVVALCLAPLFFVPPFLLLKRHGRVERGRSYFSTTRVVDRGVYGVVRHTQNVVSWALAGVAAAFFYLQAVAEERFCVRQLGAEYAAYMQRVPSFNVILGLLRNLRKRVRSGDQSRA
jgi:protein-S-isoprenylcysteine O-methyltransferase Ste14